MVRLSSANLLGVTHFKGNMLSQTSLCLSPVDESPKRSGTSFSVQSIRV